jgi:4-hydroxy-tetrahydrodipicolinate synthase
MNAPDLRGLNPAPVTPFTREGDVDHKAIQRLGSWLGSIPGVKSLVVLGHAGEGTFLTPDEQTAVIESFVKSVNGKIPIIAGITLEGTKVAALEAKRSIKAGAGAGLVYPSHGWLRFGYQKGRRRIATVQSTKRAACRSSYSSIRTRPKRPTTSRRSSRLQRNRVFSP